MKTSVVMTKEREVKNSVVYKDPEGYSSEIPNIYIKKSVWTNGVYPEKIKVSVEDM